MRGAREIEPFKRRVARVGSLVLLLRKPASWLFVLLLDEPTNCLDLPSTILLQDYMRSLKNATVVIATHDRAFGDGVAEELIVVRLADIGNVPRGSESLVVEYRSVVEGGSPYRLAPGVQTQDQPDSASEEEGEEPGAGVGVGSVYRLLQGQLERLEGGLARGAAIAVQRCTVPCVLCTVYCVELHTVPSRAASRVQRCRYCVEAVVPPGRQGRGRPMHTRRHRQRAPTARQASRKLRARWTRQY
jgi:hypothetical protein